MDMCLKYIKIKTTQKFRFESAAFENYESPFEVYLSILV
jgi:hypothetical protein